MTKYHALGIINIIISIFFAYLLGTSAYSKEAFFSIESFIHGYAPTMILLCSLIMNTALAYTLLIKGENTLPYYVYVILTFSTIFWLLVLLIGSFFASNIVFPIFSLATIVSIIYFIRKSSMKSALILSFMTLLVSIVTIISSFEEDYCWQQGAQADSTGSKMTIATQEDATSLKNFKINEGMQIGVSFRTHMLCHNTFNFTDAVKETYIFTK